MFFRRNRKVETIKKEEVENKHLIEKIQENNLKATRMESYGYLEEAERLYLENISHGVDSRYAYERLAFLKMRKGDRENQIRALEEAVEFYNRKGVNEEINLAYFRKLLKQARKIK